MFIGTFVQGSYPVGKLRLPEELGYQERGHFEVGGWFGVVAGSSKNTLQWGERRVGQIVPREGVP